MTIPTTEQREAEREKYVLCYGQDQYAYAMGGARMADALEDLEWSFAEGALTYLDIGCGRGEMLAHAERIGFAAAYGTEVVGELLVPDRVFESYAHELGQFAELQFELVSCFDVIEHLLPGDDVTLIQHMGRMASRHLALTANNHRSVDPLTNNDLHINKRPYDEWDRIIRGVLEPVWTVQRMSGKRYVSETWRAWR